jgi:adenylate cyclase
MRLGHFFTELKRRRVLRVVGAYAVAAWVAVEVWTTIQPILLPDSEWTNKLVVVLALVGFPLVFALAWIFDITPQGVQRTQDLPAGAPSGAPLASRTLSPSATGFFGLGILVALVSFAAYAGLGNGTAALPSVTSMAVLPFEDMSSAGDQQYFSEGIAEELLNRLNERADSTLRVSPRTSSFALAEQGLDTREIGRRLGVEAVLEGSVRRENDRVRVTARLVRAESGDHIWSHTFEGDATDVFALQDSIATSIAKAVRIHLTTHAAAGESGSHNAAANELYMQGQHRWRRRTERDLREALALFQRAVEADPQFARAHAALAQTYAVLPAFSSYPADSAVSRGYAAAALAIGLDPTLPQAYAAMGQLVQNFEWDLERAESHYVRALEFTDDATIHQWYAETLMLMGRYDEARKQLEHVTQGRRGFSPVVMHIDAWLRSSSGDVQGGVAAARELMQQHPGFTLGTLGAAYAGIAARRTDVTTEALTALARQLPARASLYQSISAALKDAGRAAQALQQLEAAQGLSASERVAWHLALGNRAGALRAVREGYEEHSDANLPFVLAHPITASLRSDTSVKQILREIGIE